MTGAGHGRAVVCGGEWLIRRGLPPDTLACPVTGAVYAHPSENNPVLIRRLTISSAALPCCLGAVSYGVCHRVSYGGLPSRVLGHAESLRSADALRSRCCRAADHYPTFGEAANFSAV